MTSESTTRTSHPHRLWTVFLTVALTTSVLGLVPGSSSAAPLKCGGKRVTKKGNNQANILTGTAGRDVIAGLGGNDTLDGLEGNDIICGGGGNDTIYAGVGDDRVMGEAGDDILYGDYSGTGIVGNDIIDGGPNSPFGGDWIYFYDLAVTVNLEGGTAVGEGQDTLKNLENVYGSDKDDTLIGDDQPNYLVGWDGHDVIWGRDGNDAVNGEAGNDELFGGGGVWDWIVYFGATDEVHLDLDTRLATIGPDTDEMSGFELVVGSNHDDELLGDARTNYLAGRGGEDILDGRDGFDLASFYNSVNADLDSSASGPDTLTGPDLVPEGSDTLTRLEGLWGSPADDVLMGDGGNNLMRGGEGADDLDGAGGDDYFLQDSGGDDIDGGAGTYDLVDYFLFNGPVEANLGTGEDDTGGNLTGIEALVGTRFDDVLQGDGGPNSLFGMKGDDELFGLGGEDGLAGGPGNDRLEGGPQDDHCIQGESGSCEHVTPPALHPLVVVGGRVARAERRYK